MPQRVKPWSESMTIRGLLIIVVGAVLQYVGVEEHAEIAGPLADSVGYLIQAVGVVLAAKGRQRAKGPLKGVTKGG